MKKYKALAAAMALCIGEYNDKYSNSTCRSSKGSQEPEFNIDSLMEARLNAKGLSVFVINGKNIIAHNEREAQKRYKNRTKHI